MGHLGVRGRALNLFIEAGRGAVELFADHSDGVRDELEFVQCRFAENSQACAEGHLLARLRVRGGVLPSQVSEHPFQILVDFCR